MGPQPPSQTYTVYLERPYTGSELVLSVVATSRTDAENKVLDSLNRKMWLVVGVTVK